MLNFLITNIYGLNFNFINLMIRRWENFNLLSLQGNEKRPKNLNLEFFDLNEADRYVINNYILLTSPVLVDIKLQYKYNINFWFLNRTFKGLSFKNNKPYRRKSRAKTFSKGTPKAHMRNRVNMSLWFKIINIDDENF